VLLVRERDVQHDVERAELHPMEHVRTGHVREQAGEHGVGSAMCAMRGGNVLVDGEPIRVSAARRMQSGHGADGAADADVPSAMRAVRGGYLLSGRRDAEAALCRHYLGSRR